MNAHKIKHKLSYQARLLKNDFTYVFNPHKMISVGKGKCILVYHGVDQTGNRKYNTRFISQKHFESHLLSFKKHFTLVSVSDLASGNIDENKFSLALTFDDGYKNNLDYVTPLLCKYNVPATFCITGITDTSVPILWPDLLDIFASIYKTPLIVAGKKYTVQKKYPWSFREYVHNDGQTLKTIAKQQGQQFNKKLTRELARNINFLDWKKHATYWKQMTPTEIRQLAKNPLFEIASHGYFHTNLGAIPFDEAKWEMQQSKSFLENIIQKPINTIAYPDGSYSKELVQYGSTLGYDTQLVVDYRFRENLKKEKVILNRFTINPYISTYNQILAIIKNSYY